MSETLVRRMARAYWGQWLEEWIALPEPELLPAWDALPEPARKATERCFLAALRAIREPTEPMCLAGESSDGASSKENWIDDHYTPENVELIWQSMIDAAIAEAGGQEPQA